MRKNYSGVTARFIHWFLNNDRADLKDQFYKAKVMIQEKIATRQNAPRIAFNLALNHIAWTLWVDFMLHNGAASHKEKEELLKEHEGYITTLAHDIANRCEEEQGGIIFARVLKQMIDTGEVSIKNLEGFDRERKPVIGYAPHKDVATNLSYLHPDAAWSAVMDYSPNIKINGTQRAIAKQLVDLGILIECEKGHFTKLVREGESRRRVWVVNMEKLGFSRPQLC